MWNREITLKCKLKCYVKPMKDPLGVSPGKGNQGTTRGKENFLLTSVGIEPTNSGLDLPLLCMGLSWVSHSSLIYTSELILCSTICVHGAFICTLTFSSPRFTPKSSPTFYVRPRSSVGRVTVDVIRRSWVRFPPRSKEFFLYLVWFPDSLY